MDIGRPEHPRPVYHSRIRQVRLNLARRGHHHMNAAVVEAGQAVQACGGHAAEHGARAGTEHNHP
jgi:hypothetical protein